MEKIKFITIERLMEMQTNTESFRLVETLGEDSYGDWHIPGAVNIPTPKDMTAEQMDEAAKAKGIKKDDVVVTYCASYACHASTRAAKLLLEAGYKNTVDFKAGKQAWKEANLETE